MTSDFRWVYEGFTSKWEAGDHRPTLADPNPTHNGVTQRFYDAVARKYSFARKSVFDLTNEELAGIFNLIWVQSKADKMPRLVAAAHFDTSVNFSGPRANSILQMAVGARADGLIGQETLTLVGSKNPHETARRLVGFRESTHRERVAAVPVLSVFLQGWLNRCKALREFLGVTGPS